jgi:hypothetical protein
MATKYGEGAEALSGVATDGFPNYWSMSKH